MTMKHLLFIILALTGLAIGQTSESITEKAAIAGTAVDAAADHILIQDGSVTAGQPVIKRLPIDELVDVPSLFGAVSKTELGYLDGVTSAIQTQIDGKQATIADGGLTIAKTSGLQTALDGKAPTIVAPVAVASATARKTAATYTAAEVTPVNGLRVIQDDLPDVVWTLLDATDITADANWAGAPRTTAAGALPLSGVALATDGHIPYERIVTRLMMIPYGQAGSVAKIAGSLYWREIGRMKIPASALVDSGSLVVDIKVGYDPADKSLTSTANQLRVSPASLWDNADYFGATPTTEVGWSSTTDGFMQFRYTKASGTMAEFATNISRTYTLTVAGGNITAPDLSGQTAYAYDFTNQSALSVLNQNQGWNTFSHTAGNDLEVVIVAQIGSDATDYRFINLDISIYAP